MSDTSAVERLAEEWRDGPERNSTTEAWVRGDQLTAAIEADRADRQAYTDFAAEAAKRAVLAEAEIEHLRAVLDDTEESMMRARSARERLRNEIASAERREKYLVGRLDTHMHRAERAEAENARLRAAVARGKKLAEEWDDQDPGRGDPDRADALRAALADEGGER